MSDVAFKLNDLRRILQATAGTEEGVDLEQELDTEFGELGYDSVALMETAARISQEYGIPIDDDALVAETTPRSLIALVNTTAGSVELAQDKGGQRVE